MEGATNMLEISWKDKEHPTKTVWINKGTGELAELSQLSTSD